MGELILRVRDASADGLRQGIARIAEEEELPQGFAEEVLAAARATAGTVELPAEDLTDLPFFTIDPPDAQDLDQAMYLERAGDGFRVRYAIADVAAFVPPGGPVDAEARRRGETLYGADAKIPLHPPVLSEDAASLLPGQLRPAVVWTVELDASGALTATTVGRARVRSVQRLDYEGAQADIDAGRAAEPLRLLQSIGELRTAQEAERGGVSLPIPEQNVVVDGESFGLEFRTMVPVERWNAQISLLTGIAAAQLMLKHRVGIVRTLPPPDPQVAARLRRTAAALEIDWPEDVDYPEFIRGLDPAQPGEAAMAVASTALLRGAGYAAFDGERPELTEHAGLATPYAHVTAPLRRLVDRFANEVCLALVAGEPVPDWVRGALGELPEIMAASGRRASAYERAITDLVEAHMLAGHTGEPFEAVVLEADEDDPQKGQVQLSSPAVQARVRSERPLPVGERVTVRLEVADPAERKVLFTL